MGLCQYPEMGPEVDKKWVFGCNCGSKCAKTHFLPTLNPLRDIDKNPFQTQLGGGNRFPKRALKQSRPSIRIVSEHVMQLFMSQPYVHGACPFLNKTRMVVRLSRLVPCCSLMWMKTSFPTPLMMTRTRLSSE